MLLPMDALIAYGLALALTPAVVVPAAAEVALAAGERKMSNPAAEVVTTELPKTCRQLRGCHNMFCRCLGQQWRPNQVEGPRHQGQVLLQLAGAPQRHDVGMDTSMALLHSAAVHARTAAGHNGEHGAQPLAGLGCCCRGHREAVGSACWSCQIARCGGLGKGGCSQKERPQPPHRVYV